MNGPQEFDNKTLEQISQHILTIPQQQIGNSNALLDNSKQCSLAHPASVSKLTINPRLSFYSVNNIFANDQEVKNPSLARWMFNNSTRNAKLKFEETREGKKEIISDQMLHGVIDLMSNTNDRVKSLLEYLILREKFGKRQISTIKETANKIFQIPAILKQILKTCNLKSLSEEYMENVEKLKEMALELNTRNARLLDGRVLFKTRLFQIALDIRKLKQFISSESPVYNGELDRMKLLLINSLSILHQECYENFSVIFNSLNQRLSTLNAILLELMRQESTQMLSKFDLLTGRLIDFSTLLKNCKFKFNCLKSQLKERKLQFQNTLYQFRTSLKLQAEENEILKKSLEASSFEILRLEKDLDATKEENRKIFVEMRSIEEANVKAKQENRELREEINRLKRKLEKERIDKSEALEILDAQNKKTSQFKENENKRTKVDRGNPSIQKQQLQSFYLAFAGVRSLQKAKLISISESFNLRYNESSNDFSPRTTHLICPSSYRSLRVLAAAVSCKWIVSIDWLLDSEKNGRLIEVEKYACRHKVSPLQGQFFYITPQFDSALHNKFLPGPKMAVDKVGFLNLLIELGRAKLTKEGEGIPLVLDNTSEDSPPNGMTWIELVELIMAF
jgi:hypothetical protein